MTPSCVRKDGADLNSWSALLAIDQIISNACSGPPIRAHGPRGARDQLAVWCVVVVKYCCCCSLCPREGEVSGETESKDLSSVLWVVSTQEALLEKVESLEGRLKTANKELNGAKKSAKFDKIALEGRTKTALVLEHTVATLRHDLHTNVERRQVLKKDVFGIR